MTAPRRPRKRLGRPPLAASGQHAATEQIKVLVTPEQHARIRVAAEEAGQTVAGFARAAIERALEPTPTR